jgi:dihydrolipoamide dehydrogenase
MAMIQVSSGWSGGRRKKYGELLGVHILAPFATEIIGAGALAIQMEANSGGPGALRHAAPTIAESLSDAAEALGWAIYIPDDGFVKPRFLRCASPTATAAY